MGRQRFFLFSFCNGDDKVLRPAERAPSDRPLNLLWLKEFDAAQTTNIIITNNLEQTRKTNTQREKRVHDSTSENTERRCFHVNWQVCLTLCILFFLHSTFIYNVWLLIIWTYIHTYNTYNILVSFHFVPTARILECILWCCWMEVYLYNFHFIFYIFMSLQLAWLFLALFFTRVSLADEISVWLPD